MLRCAELVIGGTRLNRAGYPQQNPALITEIVRKKRSSPSNDEIKLVSEFPFHFHHQTNQRITGHLKKIVFWSEIIEKKW